MKVSDVDDIRPTSSLNNLYAAEKCFKKELSLMLAQHPKLVKSSSGYYLLNAISMKVERVSRARKQRTKQSKISFF